MGGIMAYFENEGSFMVYLQECSKEFRYIAAYMEKSFVMYFKDIAVF